MTGTHSKSGHPVSQLAIKHPTAKQHEGRAGEDVALAYLEAQGLVLVMRNFLCKTGEIDLIMREQQTLIFVEVRTRASRGYGNAAESITRAKQRRLILAAQYYLLRFKQVPPCRIDVIAIDDGQVSWLKDAIQA